MPIGHGMHSPDCGSPVPAAERNVPQTPLSCPEAVWELVWMKLWPFLWEVGLGMGRAWVLRWGILPA